jgi:hypothetical protein
MKHRTLVILTLTATLACSCTTIEGLHAYHQIKTTLRTPAQEGPARLELREGLAVLHVYGTSAEMGRQYGTLLHAPLLALHTFVNMCTPQPFRDRCLAYARGHEADLPQPIREELHAVADASAVPYDELVALNIIPRMNCSTLAVWDPASPGPGIPGPAAPATQPSGPGLVMGRNSDYFSLGLGDRGSLVTVYHPRDGFAVASVNVVGMVGAFSGMNEKGVCFGNMLVFNAAGPPRQDGGLTIQLAMLLAAEHAGTAAEMVEALRHMRRAIPMNVMVADSREALVVELGVEYDAVRHGDDGVLAASNHFRTPALRTYEVQCPRYTYLWNQGRDFRATHGVMTVAAMKSALLGAHIPMLNLQAVVFEPGVRWMHVSINKVPAAAGPYVALSAADLFGPVPAPAIQP